MFQQIKETQYHVDELGRVRWMMETITPDYPTDKKGNVTGFPTIKIPSDVEGVAEEEHNVAKLVLQIHGGYGAIDINEEDIEPKDGDYTNPAAKNLEYTGPGSKTQESKKQTTKAEQSQAEALAGESEEEEVADGQEQMAPPEPEDAEQSEEEPEEIEKAEFDQDSTMEPPEEEIMRVSDFDRAKDAREFIDEMPADYLKQTDFLDEPEKWSTVKSKFIEKMEAAGLEHGFDEPGG